MYPLSKQEKKKIKKKDTEEIGRKIHSYTQRINKSIVAGKHELQNHNVEESILVCKCTDFTYIVYIYKCLFLLRMYVCFILIGVIIFCFWISSFINDSRKFININ